CASGGDCGSLQRRAREFRGGNSITTIIAGCSRREFCFERQARHLRYPPFAHMAFGRKTFRLRLPSGTLVLGERTLVMGVLNVTPDSFSDGGEFLQPERAIEHALAIERPGANLLDVGGESTRPGSAETPAS